jgi:hypothetical protein
MGYLESFSRLCECKEKESWNHRCNATGHIIPQSIGGQDVEREGESAKLIKRVRRWKGRCGVGKELTKYVAFVVNRAYIEVSV